MIFGIYPGGVAGADDGLAVGRADETEKIREALDILQGTATQFIVRGYEAFGGRCVPPAVEHYATRGRKLDLVLCCGNDYPGTDEWCEFVRAAVRWYSPSLGSIQICEEPNLYQYPGDGRYFPHVMDALFRGIIVARDEAVRCGSTVQIGFNAVPCFNSDDKFWTAFRRDMTAEVLAAVDYVAFDFFPDVFRPVEDVKAAVTQVLRHFRTVLSHAGIGGHVPVHIGENGWPTSPIRSYERQAEVINAVVRTICELADELNITHYEHFALRDADSADPDLFRQFGILRDNYEPKPAFETYRALVEVFASRDAHATVV